MEKMEGEKECWIIGELISKLEKDVLPTKLDALKYFFFKYTVLKMNLSQCYIETTERIIEIRETLGLIIAIQQNIVTKLKGLVNKYKMTKKNSHAVRPTQVLREIDVTQDGAFEGAKELTEEKTLGTSQRIIVLCVRIPQIGYELFA
jgi:hypothetical protein